MIIQGRIITPDDIELIIKLINNNPTWNRTQISRQLCYQWNWQTENGQLKDMSCRYLLLKLQNKGYITLPPPQKSANNSLRNRSCKHVFQHKTPIKTNLQNIKPIEIEIIRNNEKIALFKTLLMNYHYLGYNGAIGKNIKYIAFDRNNNPLSCVLFGSAAWKTESRDKFIGWDNQTRIKNLHLITNNMRFLVLPWINVPNLASHILSLIVKRISNDWISKYGHPIYLLETFVEQKRFSGHCYKAANWIYVGQTKGCSRNKRYNNVHIPIKDVYLYPLTKRLMEVFHDNA